MMRALDEMLSYFVPKSCCGQRMQRKATMQVVPASQATGSQEMSEGPLARMMVPSTRGALVASRSLESLQTAQVDSEWQACAATVQDLQS